VIDRRARANLDVVGTVYLVALVLGMGTILMQLVLSGHGNADGDLGGDGDLNVDADGDVGADADGSTAIEPAHADRGTQVDHGVANRAADLRIARASLSAP
jgi:hypothetical protein